MCLPNFIEFRQVPKEQALVGYRNWRITISNPTYLISESKDYIWQPGYELVSHEVKDKDSGIYAYNYNYNNYYNYYNYYYYNYYNNNYNYNYNYNYNCCNVAGIITQWGKVAIHREGQRSEFAKIETLFNIRAKDAKGTVKFLEWVDKFNTNIALIAQKYNIPNVISWQDFKENQK